MKNHTRLALPFRNLDRRSAAVRADATTVDIEGTTGTIRLYDPIDSWGGYWGVSAKELAEVLDSLPPEVTEIRIHVNSPGGEVFEAIAIVNMLRAHRARIVVIVDGIAASAASFIACAADETIMAPNSELMIHDAWGYCSGNASDMRTMAEMLDHVSDNIASIYAHKAGTDTGVWRTAMETETWYSADEAVAAGLADTVADLGLATDDAVKDRYDLSIFTYAGRSAAPSPAAAAVTPPSPAPAPEPAPEISEPEPTPTGPTPARIAAFRNLVATTRT